MYSRMVEPDTIDLLLEDGTVGVLELPLAVVIGYLDFMEEALLLVYNRVTTQM